jgi:crotonobetainyl-CoA:carnitine CoA-transferase CaiB-like acyl-CoA transferase
MTGGKHPDPPLAGIRILALEQFGAGPWATLQLADLGAEILKIEDPQAGGDVGRYVPPFQAGEDSLYFETFNRNKKGVSLDLRHPEGREAFHDLVRRSDAVFTNLRGDKVRERGLTYAQLRGFNERIVCCSLSGFGTDGPRAAHAGYDYLIQGLAGWMDLTGEPGAPPTKTGLSLVDLSAGYVAALALLAGLWKVRRDGEGCDCDISLFETALAELAYVGTWAATTGFVPERRPNSAHPSIVPFQNFATADGWIVIACPKEKFWARLRDVVAEVDVQLDEGRYADFASRDAARDGLLKELDAAFLRRSTNDWIDALQGAGVPSAPVNDVRAGLADEQVIARGALAEVDHPRFGTVRHVASPLRIGDARVPPTRAPARGEHTRHVLAEICGYPQRRIDELTRSGALGDFREHAPNR